MLKAFHTLFWQSLTWMRLYFFYSFCRKTFSDSCMIIVFVWVKKKLWIVVRRKCLDA